MDEPMTGSQFLDTLRAERLRWDTLLACIAEGRLVEPGVAGEWSVKDLIAHITWFEREMAGVARQRALTASDLWDLDPHARNRTIFERHRGQPLHEVLAEGLASYQQLLAALEALTDADFHDPRRFRGMPDDWTPWHLFAENTYEHYRAHRPDLAAWLDRGGRRAG